MAAHASGRPGSSLSDAARLPRAFWLAAWFFIAAASLWIAYHSDTLWDYQLDAGPPIDSLVHLRLHEFLAARPDMGPLSLLMRAPFAALGQLVGSGGEANLYLDDYRFGVFPCLVAAGLFGVALARFTAARGARTLVCAVAVVLSVVNPVSVRAVHYGHPEEILGAALLTGSLLAAVARRPWLACTLLALAVVNKQWAVVGMPSVAVALVAAVGWQRLRRPALILSGVAAALVVPLLVADAGSLVDLTRKMADLRGTPVLPANIWYSMTPPGSGGLHSMPEWLGLTARPLIVILGLVVPLAFRHRVRQDVVGRGFALLALVMLLRCALDPADNGYYHLPFLLPLLAADAVTGRFWATALACVLLQVPTTWQPVPQDLALFYALWAPSFAVYLAGRAYGLDWRAFFRSRVVRDQVAARTPPRSSSAASTR